MPDDYSENGLSPNPATAQRSPFFLGVAWDMTLPVGSSTDYINVFGVQGISFQARYHLPGGVAVGFMAAWQSWYDKSEQEVVIDNITLGGMQARAISVNPLYGRVLYSLQDLLGLEKTKSPDPYAAINFGGARTVREVDMGVYAFVEDSWHWAFAPELGVEVPLKGVTLTAATRFNYLASSGDGPEQLYMSFSLGIGGR